MRNNYPLGVSEELEYDFPFEMSVCQDAIRDGIISTDMESHGNGAMELISIEPILRASPRYHYDREELERSVRVDSEYIQQKNRRKERRSAERLIDISKLIEDKKEAQKTEAAKVSKEEKKLMDKERWLVWEKERRADMKMIGWADKDISIWLFNRDRLV